MAMAAAAAKSKKDPRREEIRVRGQPSILSTFFSDRTSAADDDNQGGGLEKKKSQSESLRCGRPDTNISLSDFLDRKLHNNNKKKKTHSSSSSTTTSSSTFIQGKETPFLSPGTSVAANGPNAHHKTVGPDLDGTLDIALQHFKHNKQNEDNVCCRSQDSIQSNTVTRVAKESHIPDLRKQTNQFEGLHGKQCASKGLVVLGGEPMPKQAKHKKSFIRKEKPLPVYNHYASGSGWWDSDMEGIDNDEVGFNEVWEGVGSATIGGLDWH